MSPGSAGQDAEARGVEIVALVTSAGGLEAVSAVLRVLPRDFPAAIVVTQHLGGQGSALIEILARRIVLPVGWAREGGRVEPGTVTVCPPRSVLEVLPDRTCALRLVESVVADRPLDALLTSVGDSFGAASLAVVLTGMGRDGAAGVAAVRAAGGCVIAQSEDSAEQPSMPRAAVEAGVDLVLPLQHIGAVVADFVGGTPLPRAPDEVGAIRATFGDDGEVPAAAQEIDWSRHPLGPVRKWSPVLRSAIRLAAAYPTPYTVFWGKDLFHFHNEAAAPTHGGRHPMILGLPAREAFPDLGDLLGLLSRAVREGRTLHFTEMLVPLVSGAKVRERWFDFVHAPIRDVDGTVGGVASVWSERTGEVLGRRRLQALNRLAAAPAASGRQEALIAALDVIDQAADIPFAAAYLADVAGTRATLVQAVGVSADSAVAPRVVALAPSALWPLRQVLGAKEQVLVEDLEVRLRGHLVGPERLPPEAAVLHPLRDEAEDKAVGVLILGMSPRLLLDDRYREFLTAVGETVSGKVAESHARHRERQRLERLAELDRAKTEFFSNVSHEFRTPLTLMLGPLEELLHDDAGLSGETKAELEMVARNAQRLMRLVGTMLDFSQIEAGRLRARFALVDLAERTREIAAQFDSAASRAGLTLRVEVEELADQVWVDADMWEKIVSNLVSNALKFTFEGGVVVTLRGLPKHAELVVRDSGVGIPAEDLPHVFKRFHRARGTRARTQEGAGIGLALVDELVRRHHGRVRVASTVGEGTAFTVWVPMGRRPQRLADAPQSPARLKVAAAMADEASRWGDAPEEELFAADGAVRHELGGYAPAARILLVDDSQDMREYLARVLAPHWDVETAADGAQALALARCDPPDLVLADVMMPGLDGFALLRELRGDPKLSAVPVVLVTARAGEESAIEGLLAGADDYIVKPFSARALVARVAGQLEVARARRHAAELNAFRIGLSDALRALDDPLEIQRTACRMLVKQLGADRVGFVEADPANAEMLQTAVHAGRALAHLPGRGKIDDWGPFVRSIRDGERLVAADTQTHPGLAAVREALAGLGIGAQLFFPLQRDGRGVVALSVQQQAPRAWTAEEVALAEEVAGRTWAEVEQARVRAELRQSEARLRALAEASPLGVVVTAQDEGSPPAPTTPPTRSSAAAGAPA